MGTVNKKITFTSTVVSRLIWDSCMVLQICENRKKNTMSSRYLPLYFLNIMIKLLIMNHVNNAQKRYFHFCKIDYLN